MKIDAVTVLMQLNANFQLPSEIIGKDVIKAGGVKAKNANVNCRENATVNLSIWSHFCYFLEKLQ